ncbi:MAG: UV damage endonuclease UvsE [Chloroflexales bacterium]|nr:UV damage endonuclease UvsE [Chloroflexales bacterium]
MIQLGFAVRVVGKPGLRAYDGRREAAHLSLSLIYLRDILVYLQRINVHFYRIAATLAPTATLAEVLRQIDDCTPELDMLAAQIARQGLRLTLHLGHHIALGAPDSEKAARSLAHIEAQAALLERLDAGPAHRSMPGILVAHVGGASQDRSSLERFAARYQALSARARTRFAVEHDSAGFSLGALLYLHQRCGVPVVFDQLHWQLHNPEALPLDLALGLALATWPAGVRPEVHLSTARSEAHLIPTSARQEARVLPPHPGQHADFVAAADLIALLRAACGLPPFDLMLEAKAGDLALLRVRAELSRIAPELATKLDSLPG